MVRVETLRRLAASGTVSMTLPDPGLGIFDIRIFSLDVSRGRERRRAQEALMKGGLGRQGEREGERFHAAGQDVKGHRAPFRALMARAYSWDT